MNAFKTAALELALTAMATGSSYAEVAGGTGKPDVLTIPDPRVAHYDTVAGSSFGNLSLRGDVSKEAGTFLSRTDAGGVAPWHWHTPIEEFVVLVGQVVIQVKGHDPLTLQPGGYSQVPAGRPHRFRCASKEACVLFVVGSGAYDMHWVDNVGKELTVEQAMARPNEVGKAW